MKKSRGKKRKKRKKSVPEKDLLVEVGFLLSEKRTYLSISRTGLAIVAVSFTALAFLLTTQNHHGLFANIFVSSVILVGLVVLIVGGVITFLRAERKASKLSKLIKKMESKNKRVEKLVI